MTVDIAAALHPLREALLEHARSDARARIAEADARAVRAADLARARRQARASVLAAQRAGYEALRMRVADTLRSGAVAEALRTALIVRVRAVLGPDARIVDHPSGGVTGEVPGRRVDCSVDALVDRVLSAESGVTARWW